MSSEPRDENIRVSLEPTVAGRARQDYTAKEAPPPGDVALNVVLRNDGAEALTVDLSRAAIPSLVLEIVDEQGRPVLLPPPPIPGETDEHLRPITLSAGEAREIQLTGFFDLGQPAGTYRVRYRHTEAATETGPRRTFASDWVEVTISAADLPRVENVEIIRRGFAYRFVYWMVCLIFYRILGFIFKKRCSKVASAEVSRSITQTITDAPPPNEAWNGTYGWSSRFNIALNQGRCEIRVTVRIRINGAITDAQRNAWEAVIESKWSNRFKLCCREDCCTNCCPLGYTILVDAQFVTTGEHFVVNAGASTTNMGNWGAADAVDVAHEFGHMLGNKDEYFTVDGVPYGPGRQPGGTIMNNPANDPVPRHYELIRQEAEKLIGAGTACVVKGVREAC